MGRNTKWIDSQPDDAVEDVARRALEARLEGLWHYLELSVGEPSSDTENVHQLRVFTRRTAAAMDIFADWLPRRRGRWMRKQLKRLRKAAGEARDLDVLRMRWSDPAEQLPAVQASLLIEQVKRRRRKAQWPIEDAYHKFLRQDFERRTRKFVKRVRLRKPETPGCDQTLGCLARVALGRMVGPFLQAAEAKMTDAETLHAFRIQSKQVRYAMELFAGAFDADFRGQLYPIVENLQDRLGAINDHVSAQCYLAAWREETDSCAVHQALDVGKQHEQRAFELARQNFLAWWTPERRAALRCHFARYVQLGAGETAPEAESFG
jgi:CHAD domain-containing protein